MYDKADHKKLANSLYQDKFANWMLSEYKDENQLLSIEELKNYLAFIEKKLLKNKQNLFLVKSILKNFRNSMNLDDKEEQKLAIVMLNFIEKAQQEQLSKITNAQAIAAKVVAWTEGNIEIASTIFTTLLDSETLISSDYLDKLSLWLGSQETNFSHLLTGENLQSALIKANAQLTEIEQKFLTRSLVFSLRVS